MGNAATKVMPVQAAHSTTTTLMPARRVAYRLPITFTVASTDETQPVSHDQIQEALGLALYTGIWQPYISNAMEEAWLRYINEGKDPDSDQIITSPADLATKCTGIVLEKTEILGIYKGYICWKSRAVPIPQLEDALDWHIADRMSMYEIQSDCGQWCSMIEIGNVSWE